MSFEAHELVEWLRYRGRQGEIRTLPVVGEQADGRADQERAAPGQEAAVAKQAPRAEMQRRLFGIATALFLLEALRLLAALGGVPPRGY